MERKWKRIAVFTFSPQWANTLESVWRSDTASNKKPIKWCVQANTPYRLASKWDPFEVASAIGQPKTANVMVCWELPKMGHVNLVEYAWAIFRLRGAAFRLPPVNHGRKMRKKSRRLVWRFASNIQFGHLPCITGYSADDIPLDKINFEWHN